MNAYEEPQTSAYDEQEEQERIAVVGMAGRFPGSPDLHSFWQNLVGGVEGISHFTDEELIAAGVPRRELSKPGYVKACPTLEDLAAFDAGFFGYTPREAEVLDPQQRLFLECAWEALEDFGWDGETSRGSTGLYAGASLSHYLMNNLSDSFTYSERGFESLIGNDKDYLASRVAYKLDLGGPAVGVQSACSTSLVAIHTGAQALLGFEIDIALAGGVTVRLPAKAGYQYQEGGLFSPDGHCRPFDAQARGTMFGSGVGVVVLKRLSDALEDGDRIRGVLLGSAVNNDGSRKVGYTAPGEYGQVRVIGEALEVAGIEPETVGFIETHGTGTALGDPIEAAALKQVYSDVTGRKTCALGAVKSNIGHLECAAGVVGFIKAILVLEKGQIPPTLHFEELNPHIDFSNSPFYVNNKLVDWPRGAHPRRAGISSFGIGGTNAHLVVEEAPVQDKPRSLASDQPLLLTLSARSDASLSALAASYDQLLKTHVQPADVCAAAARKRVHHTHRLAVSAADRAGLSVGLEAFGRGEKVAGANWGQHDPGKPRQIVFVYPGQGSQWKGMGRQLFQEPVFREAIEACESVIARHGGFSVTQVLKGQLDARFEDVDVVQPTLFAMSVGLTRLWQSWNIEPVALVGHSQGEIAAAYIAGALTLNEAARVICLRSALVKSLEGKGAMAVVELAEPDAYKKIQGIDNLSVAAVNSPRSVVLSGDVAAMDVFLTEVERDGIYARKVNVTYASHCSQVEGVLNALAARLADLKPTAGEIPIYSTVTGEKSDGSGYNGTYWCHNLRNKVRFAEMVQAACEDGANLFLEMSPHPALVHALRDCVKGFEGVYVMGSLRRDEPELASMYEGLGQLYSQGCGVNFGAIYGGEIAHVNLPTYPWHRQHYWVDAPESNASGVLLANSSGSRDHALLPGFIRSSVHRGTRIWQLEVSAQSIPFLADHAVDDQVIVPASFYLEMAQAAGWQAFGTETTQLKDVSIGSALFLPPDTSVLMQIVLEEEVQGRASFHISSCAPHHPEWVTHAHGRFHYEEIAKVDGDLERAQRHCKDSLDVDTFYQHQREKGFTYGTGFRGIVALYKGSEQALARLTLPQSLDDTSDYRIHPALLDACFQTLLAAAPEADDDATYLPVGVTAFSFFGQGSGEFWAHGALNTEASQGEASGQVTIYDQDGNLIMHTDNLRFRRVEEDFTAKAQEMCYQISWVHNEDPNVGVLPEGGAHHHPWLIFADHRGLAAGLIASLTARGERVIKVLAGDQFQENGDTIYLDPRRTDQITHVLKGRSIAGIVYCWALDAQIESDEQLENTTVIGCDVPLIIAQHLVTQGKDAPSFTALTSGAIRLDAPTTASIVAQAPLWAMCATMASEFSDWTCRVIDVVPEDAHAEHLVREILAPDGELRVAWRGETRYVARLTRYQQDAGHQVSPIEDCSGPWRLHHQSGPLDQLCLRAAPLLQPGPGEVKVAVKASGLNFRDVLVAMGRQPDSLESDAPIGAECAGIVEAVGEGVTDVKPGDAVVALALPAFASHVLVPQCFVCAKPDNLSFAEAACMLITPMTVYQALVELARLREGESVLIHSGAGGTGLAAIRIAQWLGARVYATAGNEEKREYLRSLGVELVCDSRTTQFADEIMDATDGKGVDVVLNSLRGDAMLRGLDVLAPFGRFVELGIADIYGNTRVGLWPFHKNLSYYSLEMARMIEDKPEEVGVLLRKIMTMLKEETIQPLPVTTYAFSGSADALGYMARAVHIGKIALVTEERPKIIPAAGEVDIADRGTYLVTGGLGGLGLTFARWLVERGARHLLLLGRSAPSDVAGSQLEAMRQMGATVQTARADVTSYTEMEKALSLLDPQQPLRGILHAAGRIEDAPLPQQSAQSIRNVMGPKAGGAWVLHQLTQSMELDFFVMFSSTAAVHGTPGQANYAAANGFMDALAQMRKDMGLPALSINWGGWARVGLAAEQLQGAARRFAIEPEVGLAATEYLLQAGTPAHMAVTPVPVPPHLMGRSDRPPLYALLESSEQGTRSGGDPGLRGRLEVAEMSARPEILEHYLIQQVATVLRIPSSDIAADAPLNNYGLTSLFALELRNRVEGDLGLPIPVLQFFQNRDLRTFAAKVLERLALSAVMDQQDEDDDEDYDELTI